MTRIIYSILLLITMIGCNQYRDGNQLIEEGYQLFDEYNIALKLPCELTLDSTMNPNPEYRYETLFTCSQPLDSGGFIVMDESGMVYEIDSKVYELKIIPSDKEHDIEDVLSSVCKKSIK